MKNIKYFTPEKNPEFYQHTDGSVVYRQLAIPINALTKNNVKGFLDVNNLEWNSLIRSKRLEKIRELYDTHGFSKLFLDHQVWPTVRRAKVPRLTLSASLNIGITSAYGATNLCDEEPYVRILVTGNLKEDEAVLNPKKEGLISGEIGLLDSLNCIIDGYLVVGHSSDARYFEVRDYQKLQEHLMRLSSVTDLPPAHQRRLSDVILADQISHLTTIETLTERPLLSSLNILGIEAKKIESELGLIYGCISEGLGDRVDSYAKKVVDRINSLQLPTDLTDVHARQSIEILHESVTEPSFGRDVNLPPKLEETVSTLKVHLDKSLLR